MTWGLYHEGTEGTCFTARKHSTRYSEIWMEMLLPMPKIRTTYLICVDGSRSFASPKGPQMDKLPQVLCMELDIRCATLDGERNPVQALAVMVVER